MLHRAKPPDRYPEILQRDPESVRDRDRPDDIDDIVSPDELHLVSLRLAVRRSDRELRPEARQLDIARAVSHAASLRIVEGHIVIPSARVKILRYIRAVAVEEEHRPFRQSISELEFCLLYVLNTAKSIEVLRSDRCNQTVVRMHDVADFLDLAYIPRAHLADEYLMRWLERLSYRNDDTHRRIVTLRRSEHAVLLLEQSLQEEFYARFAVAPCDADYSQVRITLKYPLSVVDVVVVDALLYRLVDRPREHVHPQLRAYYEYDHAAYHRHPA